MGHDQFVSNGRPNKCANGRIVTRVEYDIFNYFLQLGLVNANTEMFIFYHTSYLFFLLTGQPQRPQKRKDNHGPSRQVSNPPDGGKVEF